MGDDPRVRRTFATGYMPITAYQECLDWAVSMADKMQHPLYVMPLSHNDIIRTGRWERFRGFIANMNDRERDELRRIIVTTCCEVMRDSDDPKIRADMLGYVTYLPVDSFDGDNDDAGLKDR